jgi:hypothetical protein
MLFGWVPFTMFLFFTLKPHWAVLVAVIGGWLLLPMPAATMCQVLDITRGVLALGLILGG